MSLNDASLRGARLPSVAATVKKPEKPARKTARLIHSRAVGWSAIVALFFLWEWIASVYPSPGLPAPTKIWDAGWHEITQGDLAAQLLDTLTSMAYGYAAAAIVGITLGVLMARVKFLYALLEPFVELWRPIPSIIFIPVIILYAGLGRPMNILVIFISATESVILNSFSGARSIPPTLLNTAATFRLSWRQTLTEIILPSAAPQIFVGLRVALAKSLVIAVGAGMIAGDSGIGFYIITAQQTLDIPKMYAGAFAVALVGYALNALFVFTEKRLLHWDAGHDRGGATA